MQIPRQMPIHCQYLCILYLHYEGICVPSCLNLRRSLMIFIIKGFRTIVSIFIDISTTFQLICPPAFFRCLLNSRTYVELWTTSFIESTGVTCSDSVSHNRVQVYSCIVTCLQSGLNLQPPDDCLLTLCVLLDSLEWIFGTHKLNVLTWLKKKKKKKKKKFE